jgi:CRP-like cAMP-binding protein
MTIERRLSTLEKVLFLRSVELFEHAVVEQLGQIAELTQEVGIEAGETIFREGEPVDALYLVLKGRVAVEKNNVKIREINEKQSFGLVAALDFAPAPHTVRAIDPLHALKLNAMDFHEILSQDYELVRAVLRALCRMIRERQTLSP